MSREAGGRGGAGADEKRWRGQEERKRREGRNRSCGERGSIGEMTER